MEFSADYFKAKLRIRDIVDAIGQDWKKLMQQLGITEEEFTNIQALYPENELEQAKQTFALWASAKTTSSALLSFNGLLFLIFHKDYTIFAWKYSVQREPSFHEELWSFLM